MKNKLYILGLSSLVLMTSSSCSDMFEYDKDGRVTYDDVFQSYTKAGYYLNNCYAKLPGYSAWSTGNTFAASFTDEAQDVAMARPLSYYKGEMSSSNEILMPGHYQDLHEGIKHCNIFIDNIDKVPYFVIEANQSRWKGEAYIVRAQLRLQLIKRYGPMPIINHDLPVGYDYSKLKRASFYENVKAIIADCDAAIDEPEVLWRVTANTESGSLTKGIAYAIKSEAILFAASPLWNDGEDHWDEAAEITKASLDTLLNNGYAIYNPAVKDFTVKGCIGPYQDMFFELMGEGQPKNKEFIYQNKNRMSLFINYGIPIRKADGVVSAGLSPTQEMVDAYETIDGVPILDLEQPYLDAEHLQPNYNPAALVENGGMYDPNNPYENRDPRLHSTIYCNGDFHNLEKNTMPVWTYEGGDCQIDPSNKLYTVSGYYLRKMINWNSNKNTKLDGVWNHSRLADMYLNYAEAELEANGPTANAYAAVNIIRNRAGMPNLPEGLSTDEFRLRLRNERRVEFAFEERRYFDLRRWMINDKFEDVVTGMKITKNSDETFNYERFVLYDRNVTDDKYRMWPIPLKEEQKFRKFGIEFQNPGW